jgi:hypothetical protein
MGWRWIEEPGGCSSTYLRWDPGVGRGEHGFGSGWGHALAACAGGGSAQGAPLYAASHRGETGAQAMLLAAVVFCGTPLQQQRCHSWAHCPRQAVMVQDACNELVTTRSRPVMGLQGLGPCRGGKSAPRRRAAFHPRGVPLGMPKYIRSCLSLLCLLSARSMSVPSPGFSPGGRGLYLVAR